MAKVANSSEAQAEGVIGFRYELKPPKAPRPDALVRPLLAWRTLMRLLGLIGQQADRYGGLAFGNLSRAIPGEAPSFLITASQTGGLAAAGADALVRVDQCDLGRFWISARGVRPPSSESTTHALIYAADPSIHWVLHGHCPEVWRNASALALPTIAAHVGYGSPQMAEAVASLMRACSARPMVFATLGHEDGVFACGGEVESVGAALLKYMAMGLQLANPPP